MAERYVEKKSMRRRILDYAMITIASFAYGIGISLFLDPNNLAPGGVTGIAIIINRISGLPTGTGMLLINIPILLAGLWKFGIRFIVSTIYATLMSSFCTNLFAGYGALTEEPFLAAMAGGMLIAIGLGMVFKAGATTGGTDIIVKFLRLRYPHLKTGRLFFMTDVMIVIASGFVFAGVDTVMYAMLTVVVCSYMFDAVLYGRDEAKLIYIISDHAKAISDRILEELDIGVTFLEGKGAYSNMPKQVIMCVMRNTMSPKAEEIVKEEDPLAFLIITSATEIYGEGYKNIFSEKI